MNKIIFIFIFFISSIFCSAQTNPAITRWLQNTTVLGRHYAAPSTTPVQDAVVANVQSVKYSATWVYVATNGIPTYVTGPFLDGNPSLATSQNGIFKIPLAPTQNTGTPTNTNAGNIGIFINGVALFDYRDGVSWKFSSSSLAGGPLGGTGDGVWNRDAVVAERVGFDCSKGHPAMGNYHHHQNPSAFRLDLVVISNVCNMYTSDGLYAIDNTQHSPLLGFAYDGFPIYGAYGYKNTDGTGGIVRMKSSYSLRSITTRTTYSDGSSVTNGPAVSLTYPLGYFREDYQYNPTSPATPDYLDSHNGRFCVTPEYPNGMYCYFTTVDANWNSAYPYVVGPTFYGNKTAVKLTGSIPETVTTYPPSTASSIYIAASTKTICSGTTVNFTTAIYNGGLTPSYQWKINGTNAGINSNTFSSATLNNSDVVSCVLSTVSSGTATSNNITISVTTSVTPSISISTASLNICNGDNVMFTTAIANGGSTPSYQWKKNGTIVGGNTNSYSDNALANGDQIICTLTSNATCLLSATAPSNQITMSVSNYVTPSVTISSSETNICNTTNILFTAIAVNGGNAPVYDWKLNGQNTNVTTDTYQNASVNSGDVVSCVLTSNAICKTISTASSNSITMICPTPSTLALKVLIQGYYDSGSQLMNPVLSNCGVSGNMTICDSMFVELHAATLPYSLIESQQVLLNVDGTCEVPFSVASAGNNYYVVVKHRNSVETWSALTVQLLQSTSYDFTTSQSQAYGNNLVETEDHLHWAIFSGDFSNGGQDGNVDMDDFSDIINAIEIFPIGYYDEDITGDGQVESSDFSLLENNLQLNIVVKRP